MGVGLSQDCGEGCRGACQRQSAEETREGKWTRSANGRTGHALAGISLFPIFFKWLYKVVCIFHSNFNGSIIHLDVVLYIFFSQVQRDDGNDDQLPSSEVWFVGSWQQWPSESGRNATGLWHKWDVLDADAALWHFQVRGFKRNSTLFWWTNI